MFFNEFKNFSTNRNSCEEIVSKRRELKKDVSYTYEDYIANILGLFGVTDYDVARRMTLEEYNLRLKGYIVQSIDKEYFAFFNAYADRAMKAQKKNGDYEFKSIKDVFDKDKRRMELLGKTHEANPQLVKIAKNLQKYRTERRE